MARLTLTWKNFIIFFIFFQNLFITFSLFFFYTLLPSDLAGHMRGTVTLAYWPARAIAPSSATGKGVEALTRGRQRPWCPHWPQGRASSPRLDPREGIAALPCGWRGRDSPHSWLERAMMPSLGSGRRPDALASAGQGVAALAYGYGGSRPNQPSQ